MQTQELGVVLRSSALEFDFELATLSESRDALGMQQPPGFGDNTPLVNQNHFATSCEVRARPVVRGRRIFQLERTRLIVLDNVTRALATQDVAHVVQRDCWRNQTWSRLA